MRLLWRGAETLWTLKNIFCGSVYWGWFRMNTDWVNICMNLQKLFPKSLTEKFHAVIRRKLDLTLVMSLSIFYAIMGRLLLLATADLFTQKNVFAYCQLTLEPIFLLIYVLLMDFALLVLLLLSSLRPNLKNPLHYYHLMKLLMIKLHFYLRILVL